MLANVRDRPRDALHALHRDRGNSARSEPTGEPASRPRSRASSWGWSRKLSKGVRPGVGDLGVFETPDHLIRREVFGLALDGFAPSLSALSPLRRPVGPLYLSGGCPEGGSRQHPEPRGDRGQGATAGRVPRGSLGRGDAPEHRARLEPRPGAGRARPAYARVSARRGCKTARAGGNSRFGDGEQGYHWAGSGIYLKAA